MKKFLALAIFTISFTLVFPAGASAQQKEMTPEEYIATYAPLAMQHQRQYGIPASIKLAQGMLESDCGNSELSRKSNNHFGIKCKTEWTGMTVTHDDDEKGECFRKYTTIEQSYEDHSKFLAERPYYKNLFKLSVTDYKGWAQGLKDSGYATAPHYAGSLIRLIDSYELYRFDSGDFPAYLAGINPVTHLDNSTLNVSAPIDIDNYTVSVFRIGDHNIFLRDGVRYVVAREGETYESLAKVLSMPAKRLMRFNNAKAGSEIAPGEEIFIERGA